MAKAPATPDAPQNPAKWSVDDLPELAEQLDALGQLVERQKVIIEGYEGRLRAIEMKAVHLDADDRVLPSEVIAGLSPGAIFQAALTGSVVATCMANPTLPSQKEIFKQSKARDCTHFAMTVLNEVLAQMPGKKKSA